MSGSLIVISGPSGVGKGTICEKILKQVENLQFSVSATTRMPRHGETEGKNYFFLNRESFLSKIESGSFLEWAKVFDNYYGTPKEPVFEIMSKGDDVLLEIDVQGAMQIKANYPEAVLIFISPPSLKELQKRIVGRGTETPESIGKRTKIAIEEIKLFKEYRYLIINDLLDEAVDAVIKIIFAERCRVKRYRDITEFLK